MARAKSISASKEQSTSLGFEATALREYIADVQEGRFPERRHLVEMEAPLLDDVAREVGDAPSNRRD